MSDQSSRNLIIGAGAIISAVGFVILAFGVPAISAKYVEITKSTHTNIRQDAEIKYNSNKIGEIFIVLGQIAENGAAQLKVTNEILINQARFDTKLDTWEPAE